MADPAETPSYKYFNLTYPIPYVAQIEIHRPEKLNAFIEPMWHELSTLFTTLSTSTTTRCIILTGSGPRAFTTGLDTTTASTSSSSPLSPTHFPPSTDPARRAASIRTHILSFQSCISSIASCAKPVVAAIHGFCYGLGIDIATCADLRFCSADASFSVKEVDIGIAADVGTLTRLGKVVGQASWVKDVCLSGRVFGGEEAGRVGFCGWVGGEGREGVLGEALRWAGVVVGKSPVAVQGTKEILDWSRDRSVEDGLRYTAVWNSAMIQTNDVPQAIQAGLKKRTPTFEKL
ncbi:MAG: Putative enoyl CoA hydratase [Heterodermia speciosa]|uniref:Enoyl CoA hydratase n=1 Tax=Heterodermia speciosa TaxID=116794 RepID=A0A8H3FYC4_9LECA|nr:MAG: Putative enoyl CoA hydratase [Heterodermia speciosa]